MGQMGIFIQDWYANSFGKQSGHIASKIFINVNNIFSLEIIFKEIIIEVKQIVGFKDVQYCFFPL